MPNTSKNTAETATENTTNDLSSNEFSSNENEASKAAKPNNDD